MPTRSDKHDVPLLAVIGGEHAPGATVVADAPERLRAETRGPAGIGPVDFAAAMRRVEAEVYDAA